MKIAIDCRMSGKSGIGAFLDSMLPTFLQSGKSFLLIGLPKKKQEEILAENYCPKQNIEFEDCKIKTFSLKEILFFPKSTLKKINSCDIYFTPYCNIPGGIKIPLYSTIHDLVFLDMPELAGKIGTAIRKIFYLRAAQKSDGIFTVSNFSKKRILEHLKYKREIKVVYSGVPLYSEKFTGQMDIKKSQNIIFIGNIKKHKGLSTLIPAFIKFRNKIIKEEEALPQLLIVGSKENFRSKDTSLEILQESAEKNGIIFTGFLPDQELLTLIRRAKILVQPSFYEGFGVPPLQALYAGTKAIISDIEVFKEIYANLPVTFFKCGDSDDLADKIYQVWKDKEGLQKVERIYSYSASAKIILKSFENK